MSGTRPYSPGFGRHCSPIDGGAAMQRQPEPSDGKPKVPDAGGRRYAQSKRGKTRFRDDRSRKHSAASSSRHNVKKYHESNSNPYVTSPIKIYPIKKEKVKQNNRNDNVVEKHIKQIQNVVSKIDHQSVSEVVECVSPNNAFNISLIGAADEVNAPEVGFGQKTEKLFGTDAEMKSVELAPENVSVSADSTYLYEDVTDKDENNVDGLYVTLKEYLQVENKFQPKLNLPIKPLRGEIAAGTRDGAVHVLRCLKVWYDLPTDVLFHAVNLLDRFLTKMKVRPCHISCISVSCMHIAIISHHPQLSPINTEDLVSISQCKCTVGDVKRMSVIIEQKLGAVGEATTPLHWMRLFMKLIYWASSKVFGLPIQSLNHLLQESEMINKLEILLCDASCCNIRACELALVLLCTQLDSHLSALQNSTDSAQKHTQIHSLMRIVDFAMELQRLCQITDESFYASHQAVICVLGRYNARQKMPHRQCLVWRVSSRTLKVLRPTDKLTSTLPTILEQQYSSGSSQAVNTRLRSGSESSDDLCDDTKDWPTSPVVPILCSDN